MAHARRSVAAAHAKRSPMGRGRWPAVAALWREADMMKIWSEPRRARLREQIADAATIIWVWFWGSVIIQLYQFLAGFAEAGRTVHDGGVSMTQHGIELGDSL